MALRPVWIVAFAGHRPKAEKGRSAEDLQGCAGRIRSVLEEFQRAARAVGGEIELVTSPAEGADQVAIEVAESLQLPVHIILPLPIREFAEDFRDRPQAWDLALASIAKAGGLLECDAHEIATLCALGVRPVSPSNWPPEPQTGWTFRISEGALERNACFHDCGVQMLAAADALLVVCKEGEGNGLGSTRDVLSQGQARGLPTAIINPLDPAPATIDWGQQTWTRDPIITALDADCQKFGFDGAPIEGVEELLAALDGVANRTGGRFKNRVTAIIAMQFAATFLAAVNTAMLLPRVPSVSGILTFQWNAIAIASQLTYGAGLVLVTWAFVLGLASRWTKLRDTWRRTRFGAEVLRGLLQTRRLVDPLYPIVSERDSAWHRFALASGLRAARGNSAPDESWEATKSNYVRDRIEVQWNAYFEKRLAGASKLSARCGTVAFWAGAIAPISLALAFYLKVWQAEWASASAWGPVFVTLLPIILPLLAGTATSLRVVTDAGRRAAQYRAMAERLRALSLWIPALKTATSVRRAVARAERLLMDELLEWHSASKNSGK